MSFEDWDPKVGPETKQMMVGRAESVARQLIESSTSILSRCVRPGTEPSAFSRRAGLVLGLVQSGKTSSFTAVAALAHDNNFNLIVVIAGTTRTLQDQTYARLERDLSIDTDSALTRWTLLKNPAPDNDNGAALRARIKQHLHAEDFDRFDLAVPIVVVMKQHVHLNNLNALLGEIDGLEDVTALVIDDEAHMHSPNVAASNDESATYARMRTLRSRLPVHTLLQYTATPQANLLAHIADELSPEFVHLLEPGHGYTGGEYFFINQKSGFCRQIPSSETYALDPDDFVSHGPPESLRRAFVTFLLSCASDRYWQRQDPPHNTMLVHPHSTVDLHQLWFNSMQAMRTSIEQCLAAPIGDLDREALMTQEFAVAWRDLKSTNADLPPLDELIRRVPTVLQALQIRVLNSRNNQPVPWANSRYWVIVGGNILGVGFTVEGVRTTHMMRSPGVGLADTIQQRGRFFGYKAEYAPMCRAWLQSDVEEAFVDYVEHEKQLRTSLSEFAEKNLPLQEWKRVFFLDPRFRPTRSAAWKITMDDFRPDSQGWVIQRWLSLEESEIDLLRGNWEGLEALTNVTGSVDHEISGMTPNTTHISASMRISDVLGALVQLRFPGADANRFAGLRLLLASIAESGKGDDECNIIHIAGLAERRRTPTLDASGLDGTITLHQGRSPSEDPDYAGDSLARANDQISIQIHNVGISSDASSTVDSRRHNLPFIAVYVPPEYRKRVLYEERHGDDLRV